MNADLLRQRRNLIAVSVVLLVFDFADVEVASVSVLGTQLLIGNVQVLVIFAWVLWAYFFIRYYQYWRLEPEKNIRNAFQKKLDSYARNYTNAKPKRDSSGGHYNNYKISRVGWARWTYTLQEYTPAEGSMNDLPSSPLPVWILAFWCIKAAIYVLLQTPHATDHILPFALAISAPVVSMFYGKG